MAPNALRVLDMQDMHSLRKGGFAVYSLLDCCAMLCKAAQWCSCLSITSDLSFSLVMTENAMPIGSLPVLQPFGTAPRQQYWFSGQKCSGNAILWSAARQKAVQDGASLKEALTCQPTATDLELQRELASIHRCWSVWPRNWPEPVISTLRRLM